MIGSFGLRERGGGGEKYYQQGATNVLHMILSAFSSLSKRQQNRKLRGVVAYPERYILGHKEAQKAQS